MESQQIDGFSDWTEYAHPDFEGEKVEIGGFRPFWRLNPPLQQLEDLVDRHQRFLFLLANSLPQLEISQFETKPLADTHVYQVTARIENVGYLPTSSQMGVIARQTYPVQVELAVPEDTKFLIGSRRSTLPRLDGRGGHVERRWLIRTTRPLDTMTIRAWSVSVPGDSQTIQVR